jgi:anaerobic selenocysteine-containing dehydrogenase
MAETRKHYRTCNLCEAMCGIEIELQDDTITAIRGDKQNPFSRGHICPKATALQDIYEDPNRLKRPVRRTDDGWEEISWDDAFDEVVSNLKAVREQYNGNAVGVYLGNPVAHNMGSILYAPPFIRTLRTRNRFSATSVDQLPTHFASYFMFGHQFLMPVPDIDRTDHMLILGANPLASNGSLMTVPDVRNRLKAVQQRGGKVIVIDPRKTETAQLADDHYFIKPGSDALFLLAFIHTLFTDDLVKPGRLSDVIDGVEQVQALVAEFTPETVAPITGIPAESIRAMVKDFVKAESAVCYGRIGTSTQQFGGLCNWAIHTINILTGNLDEPGGAMFTRPAFDVVALSTAMGRTGSYGRWTSRVRGLPEFGGELPVSVLAEEMLTEGDGQIKAMVTIAGNPVLSTPNGTQLDAGFANLDFMVAIDIYINETTRHANIILPPTTGLETEHFDVVFNAYAVRNTAHFSEALFEPEDDQMHDWQIFQELRRRMESDLPRGVSKDFFTKFTPAQLVDLAMKYGTYDVRIWDLRENPHSVDLGELDSVLPQRLPNRIIRLAPEEIMCDISRLREYLHTHGDASANGFDLRLIGRRHLRSNNSWMHNSERLMRGKNRCTLMIHPDDAAAHQLSDEDCVTVTSRVGSVEIQVEITDNIMPGVVSIPHGFGHQRKGVQLDVAAAYAGVSMNDLTDDHYLDALTGNASLSGVPVKISTA